MKVKELIDLLKNMNAEADVWLPVTEHTLTYLSIGKFLQNSQAEACLKYIKSLFVRLLLRPLKVHRTSKDTRANISLQNFTANESINWGPSITDIVRQLYMKYGLEQSEIDLITR